MLFNLRMDPFENAEVAADVYFKKWRADRVFMMVPAGALVAQYMQTMMDFPPRQSPASFSPGAVMEKLRHHQEMLESGSGAGVK
jgi:arylsulfatase